MKTSIISPSILPSERQPKRGKTLIRTFTYLLTCVVLLIPESAWVWFLTCCKPFPPNMLMSRINSLWSSPCKHFFFSFLGYFLPLSFLVKSMLFWLMLPKSFSFSPELQGAWIPASSSKYTLNLDFLVESWWFTGQESWVFLSHTHFKLEQKSEVFQVACGWM